MECLSAKVRAALPAGKCADISTSCPTIKYDFHLAESVRTRTMPSLGARTNRDVFAFLSRERNSTTSEQ